MKIRLIPLFFVLSLWCTCLTSAYAQLLPELIYVVNTDTSLVYSVDPVTGGAIQVTPIAAGIPPGSAGLNGIKIANASLGYTVGSIDRFAYSVNLKTGAFSRVSSTPIGIASLPSNLALANDTLAYVTGQGDNNIYSLNLATGSSALVATIPGVPFSTQINSIALKGSTGYVVGYNTTNIYAVNLLNGTTNPITTTLPASLIFSGIALLDNTAYVTAFAAGTNTKNSLYAVDLSSGIAILITEIPGLERIQFIDIAIVDGIAYTAGASNNIVYAINLQTGAVSIVTPTPVPGSLDGLFGLGVLLPSTTPTNLMGGQQKGANSGFEREFFNTIRWQAAPNVLGIVGYFVYRDGIKIATLSASTFAYEDHNQKKGAATLYAVTSFFADGTESNPISATIN